MRSITVFLLVVLLSSCSQQLMPSNGEGLESAAILEKQIVAGGGLANAPDAQFGRSVALEGERMVVTCECVGKAAVAYILERTETGVWKNVKTLQTPKPTRTYMEPQATLSGDTVVISSAETGIVSVFEQNEGGTNNWGLVKELRGSRLYYDGFGVSVSLEDNTLVVGAFMSNVGTTEYQGSAYVFQRNKGGINTWGQVAQLTARDGESWDSFGSSVAISGDTVIVGAYTDDIGNNFSQGSAYLFERSEGGANQWEQTQKLLASGALPQTWRLMVTRSSWVLTLITVTMVKGLLLFLNEEQRSGTGLKNSPLATQPEVTTLVPQWRLTGTPSWWGQSTMLLEE
jgi:hypothetical protein